MVPEGIDKNLLDITILYAEDEPDTRQSLYRFLKQRVSRVILAEDGKQALQCYHNNAPDIVITDIQMPGINGLDLTRRLKFMNPQLPVIVTTAYHEEKLLIEAIEVGVDAYLKKPIKHNQLERVLNKFVKLRLLNKQLQEKNELLQLVLDLNPEFVLVLQADGKILYMNRSFLDFLGFANLEQFNQSKANLDNYIFFQDREKKVPFSRFYWENCSGQAKTFQVKISNPICQETIDCLMKVFKAPNQKSQLIFFSDISQIEKEKIKYQTLALTDPLTKIYNRLKFDDALTFEMERARRYQRQLSLIMLDLDHFKNVNDSYGHQTGDSVLQELAQLIKKNIRKTDIFARYGGEEFVILSPETNIKCAQEIAEKLRLLIEKHLFQYIGHLTCSFGVTEFVPSDTTTSFIHRADMALYRAKSKGRNRIEIA